MKEKSKTLLHKYLTIVYYFFVILNFIIPAAMVAISSSALSRVDGLHWTIRWTVWLTFAFSIVEFMSQLRRTIKQNTTKGK